MPAAPSSLDRAHRRARGQGVSRPLHRIVRFLLVPLLRGWFRVHITGAERLPREGAGILTPNHKSFLDAFFISLASRRPLRFMAKAELFRRALGWLLIRLGAFPVRRGESDADAIATATAILEAGDLLVLFPEGTRVDEPDVLGAPHHGAGRLALETGAPIIPVAISGTSHLWFGPFPRPRHVRLAILEPIGADTDTDVGAIIDERVWPALQEEYGRLRATPGVVISSLAALGLGARFVARHLGDPAPPRILGVVPPRQLRRKRRRRRR